MTFDSASSLPGICVFCGSSQGEDPAYAQAARTFGALIAINGFRLVFGGGRIGLMGETATGTAYQEGAILGIIPDFLRHVELPLRAASKIVVTETLSERKAKMFEAAMGFAVLPGGIGTYDEFFEAISEGQLGRHEKPIVLINIKNYFVPLIALLEHSIEHGFANPSVKDLFQVVETPEEAIKIFAAKLAST